MHYNKSIRGNFIVLADEAGIYMIDKNIEENKILIDKINNSNPNHIQVIADEEGNITDILDIEVEIIETIPTKNEINKEVIKKIRQNYDINKEFEMQRRAMIDINDIEYIEYINYVNQCIEWGISEKEKYGIV